MARAASSGNSTGESQWEPRRWPRAKRTEEDVWRAATRAGSPGDKGTSSRKPHHPLAPKSQTLLDVPSSKDRLGHT